MSEGKKQSSGNGGDSSEPKYEPKYSFDVKREESLRSIQERDPGKRTSWHWSEVWQEAHEDAFVVAKMVRGDLLKEVHDSLERAIANGTPFEKWKKEIVPKLEGEWIGKTVGELWDELPDEEKANRDKPEGKEREKVINAHRLKTIYEVNMRVANARERYKQLEDRKESLPYWQYVSLKDNRTRASHFEARDLVFRHDDVFWETHYPPNGWNCRCYVVPVDEKIIKANGLRKATGEGHIYWSADSKGREFAVYDGTTPRLACDPGWSYCVGRENRLKQTAAEKEKTYPPELKKQADKAQAEHDKKQAEQANGQAPQSTGNEQAQQPTSNEQAQETTSGEHPKNERTNEISEAAEAIEKAITETQKQATDAAKKIAPIAKKAEDLRKAYEYQEKALGIKCVGVQETDRNQAITAASSASEAAKKAEDSSKKAEEAQKQLADLKLKASKAKENGSVQETLTVLQRVRELKADCEDEQKGTEAFAKEADTCQKLLQSALASTASLNAHIQQDYTSGVRYTALYDKMVQAEAKLIEKELKEGEALTTWDERSRLAFKDRVKQILEASKANNETCQALGKNDEEAAARATDGFDLLIQMRKLHNKIFEERVSHLPKDEQIKERRKRREIIQHRLSITNNHTGILCRNKSNPTAEERKKERLMRNELRLVLYNFTPEDLAVFDKYYAEYAKNHDYLYRPVKNSEGDWDISYYDRNDKCFIELEGHELGTYIYKAPETTVSGYKPYFDWLTKFHEESHHLDHISGRHSKKGDEYGVYTFPNKKDKKGKQDPEGKEAAKHLSNINKDIIAHLNRTIIQSIQDLNGHIEQLEKLQDEDFDIIRLKTILACQERVDDYKGRLITSSETLNNWERTTVKRYNDDTKEYENVETSEITDMHIRSLAEALLPLGKLEELEDGNYILDFNKYSEIFDALGLTSHGSFQEHGLDENRLLNELKKLYREQTGIIVTGLRYQKHDADYDAQDKGHKKQCDETSELWAEFNATRLTDDPDVLDADQALLPTSYSKFLELWNAAVTKILSGNVCF